MTKREYLDQLKTALVNQERSDIYQILADVERKFNDAVKQGESEQSIIDELGTPENYATSLFSNKETEDQPSLNEDHSEEVTVETPIVEPEVVQEHTTYSTTKQQEVVNVKKTYKSSSAWSVLKFISGFVEVILGIKLMLLVAILLTFGTSSYFKVINYETSTRSFDIQAVVLSVCNDDTCRGLKMINDESKGTRQVSIDFCEGNQCQFKGADATTQVSILLAPIVITMILMIVFLITLLHLLIYLPSSKRIKSIKAHNREVASWN